MKKFSALLTFLFILYLHTSAQIFVNENCGASDFFIGLKSQKFDNIESINKYLKSINYNADSVQTLYRVPVKFHIYRSSSGKGGASDIDIKNYIHYLNYYYSINKTGISFYLNPEIDYIDNDRLYNMRYILNIPFQSKKNKTKGNLNVLVVNKLELYKFGKKRKDYNGTFNTFSKAVIICNNTSTSSLSHETGHFFGLKHPHRHWKRGKRKQEPVDRNKKFKRIFNRNFMCEKNGDGLCDTPAEPDLTRYSDKNCKYTGWNVTDNWGQVYKPSTVNIMSYTRNRECRNLFTEQQIAVMLKNVEKNKFSQHWKTNQDKNNKFTPDLFEPDFSMNSATEIFIETPQKHNFNLIYVKKKKLQKTDNTDWLFFEIKNNQQNNFEIFFENLSEKIPAINFKLYYESELILEQNFTEKAKKIKVDNPKKGKYFIKIEKMSSEIYFSEYEIKLISK